MLWYFLRFLEEILGQTIDAYDPENDYSDVGSEELMILPPF